MARYAFLHFESGVDWHDVDKRILNGLNRLGAHYKTIITITSGYRTREHQAQIWEDSNHGKSYPAAPPGSSQHEFGQAVDANVGGTAIVTKFGNKVLGKFGLSGIYNKAGKPFDPVHVQLAGTTQTGGSGASAAAADTSASAAAAPEPSYMAPDPAQETTTAGGGVPPPAYSGAAPPVAPTSPMETVPYPQQPGAGGLGIDSVAQAWKLIAAQPMASPESSAFAQQLDQAMSQ